MRLPLVRQLRCVQFRRLRPLATAGQTGLPLCGTTGRSSSSKASARDIRGRGLEVGTTETIRRYGGARLASADAIDLAPHSPE